MTPTGRETWTQHVAHARANNAPRRSFIGGGFLNLISRASGPQLETTGACSAIGSTERGGISWAECCSPPSPGGEWVIPSMKAGAQGAQAGRGTGRPCPIF